MTNNQSTVHCMGEQTAVERPEWYPAVSQDEANALNHLGDAALSVATRNGFYSGGEHPYVHLNMMHDEISEASDMLRNYVMGEPLLSGSTLADKHLPHLPGIGVELADVILRVLGFCSLHSIDIGTCVREKHAYNAGRPYKHGKQV